MFNLLKHVLGEYKSLVVKMHMDAPKNKLVTKNLDLFCDLELVFGLPYMYLSNVGNGPHIDQVHSKVKCLYL
jgi:hypothetical protein